MKVCWILPDIGRYHHARANAVGSLPRHDVHVVEISDESGFREFKSPDDTQSRYTRHTLVRGRRPEEISLPAVRNEILMVLRHIRPDVVFLNGWSDRAALAALVSCIDMEIPRVLIIESTRRDKRRNLWSEIIKRRVIQRFQAAFVGGLRHREYACALGFPSNRVVCGYSVVDNDHFASGSEAARGNAIRWRTSLGLPERYFLTVARLIPQKNIEGLLEAYARYQAHTNAPLWDLVIAGDGPLREDLITRAKNLDIARNVVFLGFKGYDDLPACYGLAGALVHPAKVEPWGLVVNEAMAAGLPVLVSEQCGCVPELVRAGINGFTFKPNDLDALAHLMRSIAEDRLRSEAMARQSVDIIKQCSPSTFALKMSQATELALSGPISGTSYIDCALLSALMRR